MSEPRFLTAAEVDRLHELSIQRYGGTRGLRDEGGMQAAVEQPKNALYYGNRDLFDAAAAYLFHLAQAQAYLDGNKRTATASALVFLELNGVILEFAWTELYDLVIAVANRTAGKPELAKYFRDHAKGTIP